MKQQLLNNIVRISGKIAEESTSEMEGTFATPANLIKDLQKAHVEYIKLKHLEDALLDQIITAVRGATVRSIQLDLGNDSVLSIMGHGMHYEII